MICRDGMVGVAGRAASIKPHQSPLETILVLVRAAGKERCTGNGGEREAAPVIVDLGSALLSGALHVAAGAPSPPVLHPDPMMEFYKGLCSDDWWSHGGGGNHGLGSHAQ